MRDPSALADIFLSLPHAARTKDVLESMFAESFQEGRRHGERWTETAVAHWLAESAYGEPEAVREALSERAQQVGDQDWRRPEFKSSADLEAEAKLSKRFT